jgi:hypothetical protein
MRTISNREFTANPDLYFGMASTQDVRIRKGRQTFRLVRELPVTRQPVLQPDDDLRNAITAEELLKRIHEDIDRKWDERHK